MASAPSAKVKKRLTLPFYGELQSPACGWRMRKIAIAKVMMAAMMKK